MRRLPILLAFGLVFALVFALLALAPATAGKPSCDPDSPDYTDPPHQSCKTDDTTPTTTEPEGFERCVFDENGVLEGWPENGELYRCKWVLTPEEAEATYSFQIQSDTVERVKLPQLTVNAEAWTPSSICFNEWAKRPLVPFPPDGDPLWTLSPADDLYEPSDGDVSCADGGPYLFAIRVNRVKGGTVKLVMSPPGIIQGP